MITINNKKKIYIKLLHVNSLHGNESRVLGYLFQKKRRQYKKVYPRFWFVPRGKINQQLQKNNQRLTQDKY